MLGALIPVLVPLLPGIIQGVESLFKAKKGKEKKEIAVDMAAAALKTMRENGTFSGDEGIQEVMELVETVFAHMKSTGQLQEAKEGEHRPLAAPQRVVFEGVLRAV